MGGRNRGENTGNPGRKISRRSDEADDEIAVLWEVIEVARMNDDALFFEQRDGEIFVGASDRDTKHGVPAALDFEAGNGGSAG
jgi:hypothetical protein